MSNTDQISLIGIKGFGYHGVFEHEAADGQDFFVDVVMNLDLSKPSQSDNLEDTVDYGAITDLVVSEIAGDRVQLIEKLASRIADAVLKKDQRILNVSITVHKPSAPVSAEVKDIAVTIRR
jgi:dihydroneopterin aldolase